MTISGEIAFISIVCGIPFLVSLALTVTGTVGKGSYWNSIGWAIGIFLLIGLPFVYFAILLAPFVIPSAVIGAMVGHYIFTKDHQ